MTPKSSGDGVIVVDKPGGLTSQQVVSRIKRALGIKKVGHAGTLDPMATGVLVIGIGRATRLLGFIAGADKEYAATIRLGQATTTDDAEGTPIGAVVDATGVSDAAIAAAMDALTGDIEQTPSAVSAIKIDGKRAYAMVRAGETPELNARDVTVTRFEVLARHDAAPFADLDVVVECSTGTYVRALARDLGAALQVGGHLTALRRTRVGRFGVTTAVPLEGVTIDDVVDISAVARACFTGIDVDAAGAGDVGHGRPLQMVVPAKPTAVFGPSGQFLALYEPCDDRAVPLAVFVDGVGA